MDLAYTAVLIPESDGGYVVHIPALGCHTQGDDLKEALWMAQDAIEGVIEVLEEDGDPIPPDVETVSIEWGDSRQALVYKIAVREAALVA